MNDISVTKLQLKKFIREEPKLLEDLVAAEIPFTILCNHREIVTLLCTPKYLKELAIGFLQSEGFINRKEDIENIHLDDRRWFVNVTLAKTSKIVLNSFWKRTITSGCGKGTVFYNAIDILHCSENKAEIYITPRQIYKLMNTLQHSSDLFLETGGTHCAAISDANELFLFREDIGRHNAIDKMFGECLLNQIDLRNKVVLTSGRLSSEIVIKLAKRHIPIVISRSAPTSLAIETAQKTGMTLIGFTRGAKMNLYANDWRIKI